MTLEQSIEEANSFARAFTERVREKLSEQDVLLPTYQPPTVYLVPFETDDDVARIKKIESSLHEIAQTAEQSDEQQQKQNPENENAEMSTTCAIEGIRVYLTDTPRTEHGKRALKSHAKIECVREQVKEKTGIDFLTLPRRLKQGTEGQLTDGEILIMAYDDASFNYLTLSHELLHSIRQDIFPHESFLGYSLLDRMTTFARMMTDEPCQEEAETTLISPEANEFLAELAYVILPSEFPEKICSDQMSVFKFAYSMAHLRDVHENFGKDLAKRIDSFEEKYRLFAEKVLEESEKTEEFRNTPKYKRFDTRFVDPDTIEGTADLQSFDLSLDFARNYLQIIRGIAPYRIKSAISNTHHIIAPLGGSYEHLKIFIDNEFFRAYIRMMRDELNNDPEEPMNLLRDSVDGTNPYHSSCLAINKFEDELARDWPKILAKSAEYIQTKYIQPILTEVDNMKKECA
jgi:hypothetical protein